MFSTLHLPNNASPPPPPPPAALLAFASSLTPDFELTAPHTLTLDLLSLPHAQVAPEDWLHAALHKAIVLQTPLHLSLASTPDLAHLTALSPLTSSTLTYTPAPTIHILDHLSHPNSRPETCDLKPATSPHSAFQHLPLLHSAFHTPTSAFRILNSELLLLWGIHTLGDLAALPRQGLAERLGPETARLHDILHGKHHRLLTLHRPPQHFHCTRELEDPLETLEPLLFLLSRALHTLTARLAAAQRAARAIHLSLTFDDGNLHLRELRIPDPSRDPQTLLRLLHTHLDTLSAPAPVVAFSLKLLPTLPAEAQHHLFEHTLRDPNKFADTLARIEALLGPHRLGTPQLLDSHQPDSFTLWSAGLQPATSPTREAQTSSQTSPFRIPSSEFRIPTALPLRRYRPPIPIHVASESRGRHHHPLALLDGPHQGPIINTLGPFPLSGHWWNPADRWQHTEWDIQLHNHPLLRLAHLPPHTWQLEGIY